MGRKIPSKKHRGVKDPLKQQAQRFQSIKDKINAPPTDPDDQPVPRSLQRLFAFQEPRAPASKVKKKKTHSLTVSKRDDNPVAALKRMPGEAGRAFSMRINSAVRALHSTDQEDYPLDLEETDTRGEYIASQRLRRQRKHRQAVARAGAGEGGERGQAGERLSKTQRRALKRKEQQQAKQAETSKSRELEARELRYERVAFGDVAHAPPALAPPRRALLQEGAPRVHYRSKMQPQINISPNARFLHPTIPCPSPMKPLSYALRLRYERVAFGDVAHAPPALAPPRRALLQEGAPRPGSRDLLLAGMLRPGAAGGADTPHTHTHTHKHKPTPAVNDAERMRRERARLAAVDAYRALKKQQAAEKQKSR